MATHDHAGVEQLRRLLDAVMAIGSGMSLPDMLGRIVEITEGSSLTANIALVEHNARLGAAIALEYAAG